MYKTYIEANSIRGYNTVQAPIERVMGRIPYNERKHTGISRLARFLLFRKNLTFPKIHATLEL
jgi:hypothetical protein